MGSELILRGAFSETSELSAAYAERKITPCFTRPDGHTMIHE